MGFIENGDAAERQKNHGLGNQSSAAGDQHVPDFVGRDAGQHNPNQRKVARPVGRGCTVYSVQKTNKGKIRKVR